MMCLSARSPQLSLFLLHPGLLLSALILGACDPDGSKSTAPLERPSNETCMALERPPTGADVTFTQPWPNLRFNAPVAMRQLPGDDRYWYVVEQGLTHPGRIVRFDGSNPDVSSSETVLDLSDLLNNAGGNEWGVLGMDFHPDFASNGYLYVSYTGTLDRKLTSFIVRYTSSDGGATFDRDTAHEILHLAQPFSNHNGGNILFGPDGYLYAGFGDGGSQGDPAGNGQNTDVWLAKMLRIDVDAGDPYGIPDDNPFADGVGGAPEVYAWGLRNPWRWSFDSVTGDLWAGDVGQNDWEEVDLIRNGGNYGWNAKEGTHCYDADPCDSGPWIEPVTEYKHNNAGGVSITGGYVYRGSAIPSLVGTYLYADAYYGRFWALTYDPVTGEPDPTVIAEDTGLYPVSFGQDHAGEVYFTDWDGGRLYRIDPGADAPVPEGAVVPTLLSETGCVDPAHPMDAAPGLISYEVNSPLWSDGADKSRWFAIPDGTQIAINADGTWTFPIGSVIVKQFRNGDQPMETRLMVLHEDGAWAGYSYAWNDAGTDATLLAGSSTATFGDTNWTYPSRAECLRCHTTAAGSTLGLRTEQLNRDHTYAELDGGTYNQVDALATMGFFDVKPAASGTLPAWPSPTGTAPASERGRAYVASNCAYCHLAGGTGGGAMDLRYDTPFEDMGICDAAPVNGDLGVNDALLFDPGSPYTSLLALRMATLGAQRMPQLGTSVVDVDGLAAVHDWIATTTACP